MSVRHNGRVPSPLGYMGYQSLLVQSEDGVTVIPANWIAGQGIFWRRFLSDLEFEVQLLCDVMVS